LKYYSAFGLTVASAVALPELLINPKPTFPIDIFIRIVDSKIEAPVATAGFSNELEVFTASNESFGFRVSFGRFVEVWVADSKDLEVMRPLLLGPILTVALHQKRLWPLHVGAVEANGQAWLITGPSGAGKSTLVAYLANRFGLAAISDDAGVLFDCDGGFEFAGASRSFRLTLESCKAVYGNAVEAQDFIPNAVDNKIRVQPGISHPEKPRFPVAGMVCISDVPADSTGPPARLVRLSGFRTIDAVRTAIFHPFSDHRLRTAADTLKFCASVAQQIPIYDLQRVRDLNSLDAVAACLSELFWAK
jgi:hypothetical protein